MFLITIDTQPVDYVEDNFTLEELDGNVDETIVNRLVDGLEDTKTKLIKDYDTTTKINIKKVVQGYNA